MSDKLTSLKGFGEGDPKPEKKDGFGTGKVLFKSKGFDKAEAAFNAKSKALGKKLSVKSHPDSGHFPLRVSSMKPGEYKKFSGKGDKGHSPNYAKY